MECDFYCKFCPFKASSFDILLNHYSIHEIRKEDGKILIECLFCKKKFLDKSSKTHEISNMHKNNVESNYYLILYILLYLI